MKENFKAAQSGKVGFRHFAWICRNPACSCVAWIAAVARMLKHATVAPILGSCVSLCVSMRSIRFLTDFKDLLLIQHRCRHSLNRCRHSLNLLPVKTESCLRHTQHC